MNILNLTQHVATAEQVTEGVVEPNDKAQVSRLLTVESVPTPTEIETRVRGLALLAEKSGCSWAMIGGAPWLMSRLERALLRVGIVPIYSFSKRESVEKALPDGAVMKTQVFKHAGWVPIVDDYGTPYPIPTQEKVGKAEPSPLCGGCANCESCCYGQA